MSRSDQRSGLLAKIHIAKKDLGLDDDTYRSALKAVIGRRSCSKASVPELERALKHLKERGWKQKGREVSPQTAKIHALWRELDKLGALRDASEQALRSYTKRMTGVSAPEWLNVAQAGRLIETLKQWVSRVKRKKL